jgi:hypothetical protein
VSAPSGQPQQERLARWAVSARSTRLRVLAPPAVTAAVVAYVGVVDPNHPGHYPTCPFLALTGLYCPGCGSLRAIHALAHGHLGEAFGLNVLTVLAVPLLVAAWARWARRVLRGRPRMTVAPAWVLWGLLAVELGFWVLRNVPGFEFLAP